MEELELGAFRPSASGLFFKDLVWTVFATTAAMLWVMGLVVIPMMDDGTTDAADTASTFLFAAAADTVLVIGIIYWRYGRARALAERGVITKARITKVTAVGDQVGVEYEFLVEGKTHKGSRGGGMFATREKLGALVGNDIMLLVDPQKPKVHVMLSKLEQVIRRYA